jgi:hypothetical protein
MLVRSYTWLPVHLTGAALPELNRLHKFEKYFGGTQIGLNSAFQFS